MRVTGSQLEFFLLVLLCIVLLLPLDHHDDDDDDGGDDDDDDYLSELGSHQRPKMGFGQSFGWPVTIRLCALWIWI